jgi:hypothetical protein
VAMDEGMASWRPPVGRRSSTAKLDVGVDEGVVVAGEDVEGGASSSRQSTKRERRPRFGAWRRTPLSGLAQTHGVWLDAEGTSSG